MAKPTYEDVIHAAHDIINGHRGTTQHLGNEYAAACGTLMSILGMVIDGSMTKSRAFQALQERANELNR